MKDYVEKIVMLLIISFMIIFVAAFCLMIWLKTDNAFTTFLALVLMTYSFAFGLKIKDESA